MSTWSGTVLVTGATGFIGSALVKRLAGQGTRTLCLVRQDGSGKGGIELSRANIEVRSMGSGSVEDLAHAIGDLRPELVFHLAASGVNPELRDPERLVEGNVLLTTRLISALRGSLPRRFLHIGSCSEYGSAVEPERIREDHALDPLSLYGAAKAAAYLCGKTLAARIGLPFVTLRLFGVYGPGEAPARLIPYLLHHYRTGQIPSLTPGEQARDFTYVEDIVDALLTAADSSAVEPGLSYNVCSGVATRVLEVAAIVAKAVGFDGPDLGLGRRGYRDDEAMWIVGEPARFVKATGWAPRVSMSEGVRRMCDLLPEVAR